LKFLIHFFLLIVFLKSKEFHLFLNSFFQKGFCFPSKCEVTNSLWLSVECPLCNVF